MDCHDYITNLPERKKGQHLQREERGAIQALKGEKLSNRAIAKILGCSPTTVGNELKRGTAPPSTKLQCQARRSCLQSQQKPIPEAPQDGLLHLVHCLGGSPGQRTQVVFRCLRGLCQTA